MFEGLGLSLSLPSLVVMVIGVGDDRGVLAVLLSHLKPSDLGPV